LQTGAPPPLDWISSPPLVAAVFIAFKSAERPGGSGESEKYLIPYKYSPERDLLYDKNKNQPKNQGTRYF